MSDKMDVKQEHKDIEDLLSKMITAGGIVGRDESGRLHYMSDPDDPITMAVGDDARRTLYIYNLNVKDPDGVILNPIGDGISVGREKLWFFQQLSATCCMFTKKIMTDILLLTLEHKKEDNKPEDINKSLLPLLAKISSDVDEKLIDEFNKILNASPGELFKIYYDKKHKTAKALTCFQPINNDTSFQASFGTKIRKKSWKFFDEFIGMIFNADKPIIEEYQFTSISTGYAYFEAFTSVWLRVWKVFIPLLEALNVDIGDTKDNLKDIENYMKDIDMYHKRSMWTGQATCTKSLVVPGTPSKFKEKETTPPWGEGSKDQVDTEKRVDTGVTDAMELLRRNKRSSDCVVIDRDDRSSRGFRYDREESYGYSRSFGGRSSFSGFTLVTDLPRNSNRWSSRDRRYR